MTTINTTPLHMVRAEIDTRNLHRWMGARRLHDPDHAMHCLLVECFGDLAPKPFRLILPHAAAIGCLYGYARHNADALRESAAVFADPLQSRVLPAGKLDSKPMPSTWQASKRLGFETRIRPIVRRSRNTAEFAGKECDAFLREALQFPQRGGMMRGREEVYVEWLALQFERIGGAELEHSSAKLVSFQRSRAYRKPRSAPSEGPGALLRGVLTVTDPAAFTALLTRGVGRHRSYGYGMLLLRPPSE